MGWEFYVIVGGSLALAIFISWLGVREEKRDQQAG